METRSIAIGLVAIVAAFAAAFGMAKSGGSKTENAGAGVKAQSIKIATPPAVTGVEVGGTLPALKTQRKAVAKKKAKKPSSNSTSNTSSPSTNNSSNTTNSTTNTPSTTNSTPPATHTNPSPPVKQPTNKPSTPKPQPTPAPGGGTIG